MFLGTYHSKLHGQSNADTLAVGKTYNLLIQNKKLLDGEKVDIDKDNLLQVCNYAKACLLEDKTVLHLKPRLHIIGDLCGNYNQIWKLISTNESTDQFLFLGDYVNHGKHSFEVITLVLCLKCLAPKQVFLLRGGQETEKMTEKFGFKNECLSRFDEEVYQRFLEVFECMPLAAVVSDNEKSKSILFMNGGLSPNLTNLHQLEEIRRPIKEGESGLIHEILFSTPNSKVKDFSQNDRINFGKNAVHRFLKHNHLDQLVVSHRQDDFYYPFGEEDQCVLSMYSAAGMNVYLREDMLYTFSNRTNLNNHDEKLNSYVDPIENV